MLKEKLQEELKRFNEINRYAKKLMMEQDVPAAPPAPPAPEVPAVDDTLPTDEEPPALDTAAPVSDMAPMGSESLSDTSLDTTEEVDVTDLVDMTKSIKKDIENTKMDNGSVLAKMDSVFTKLDDLESKLASMNQIFSKINQLGDKVEQMKPKTPQEKLEMRSLDSYPFNEKPQEFFAHKMGEMEASGKNEYVLTKDEVDNYSPDTIRKSFNPISSEDEYKF
jgi:hypothetical protein